MIVPDIMRRREKASYNARQEERRTRALRALTKMRRENLSLAEACRLEHMKPATFLRYVGRAVRQDRPGGRYRATDTDRFRRDLQIPTALGPARVPVYGSKAASELSKYANAINRYLRTGDTSRLRPFQGRTIRSGRERIELITDPATLSSLAQAGALRVDQLYASLAGMK
jgi:hypothetical protein